MQLTSDTHPSGIFSFCPKCGHQGFEFDTIKKFVCKACGFTFYINAAAAVAVILETREGKIVLTKRKFEPRAGFYDLPGGFVDTMERVEDAVKREVFEELGIEVNQMRFLASFPNEYTFKGISYYTCDMAFICPIDDLSSLNPADDVAEAMVIRPREIDFNIISFPSIVNILRTYMEEVMKR
ncbi:MAG TPA: NUDIX domain-containing protein [Bacteroidales bacterium]